MTMRLIRISVALLFYANLARATFISKTKDVDPRGYELAEFPVDLLEGVFRCQDHDKSLVDSPIELRKTVCGNHGVSMWNYGLMAVVMANVKLRHKNIPYLCCIDPEQICAPARDVQLQFESLPDGVYKTAVSCSDTKPCQYLKRYFCLEEAGKDPNHYQRTDNSWRMGNWKRLPLCCEKHKSDETCDYEKSDFVEEEYDVECEKYFGRCKEYDHTLLCSKKKHDKWLSSCCKPHKTELCPGGIYPFGLKGKNGLVDWIADNFGFDDKVWKEACLNLAKYEKTKFAGAKLYISNDNCCAMAKLNIAAYYGGDYANLLTDHYDRFSTMDCENDADCGEDKFCGSITSSYAGGRSRDEAAEGKTCFEKIHCPHKTKSVYPVLSKENSFICSDSSTCPTGTICIWGKPAAATASKIKKSFGMCCPKAAYETDVCTAKLLGNAHNTDPGIIEPTILSQEKCTAATQKWHTIDTGAGGTEYNETKVCCQYKPVQFDDSTCTVAIMGNRTITGMPIEDPNADGSYLSCDKEKKRKADEPKISCGENMGFCFTDPGKPDSFPGVCCDTGLCPDGITALSDVPICDDKCMWSNSAEKGKYCVADKKNVTKCCPPKFIPAPDWRSGRYEPNAPKNTEATKTNVSCVTTMDCGGYGTFCEEKEKVCYRLGTQQYDSSKHKESCTKAADCKHADYKDYKWWCVAFGPATGHLHCVTPTRPKPTMTRPPATTTKQAATTMRPPAVTRPLETEASSDTKHYGLLFHFVPVFLSLMK